MKTICEVEVWLWKSIWYQGLVSTHSPNINDTELHKVWSMGAEETNQRQEIQNVWMTQVQSIDKKFKGKRKNKKEEKEVEKRKMNK